MFGSSAITTYTDGDTSPAHPVGVELVFNNAGTMTAVSDTHTLPVAATLSPAASQRVTAQSGDLVAGAIADLATLLTLSGTPTDAASVNSFMGRLTKIRDLLNATLTVSGSGNFTVTQATGTNLHSVVDSGTVTANAGTNLNTSALALEAGHLATIDSHLPAQGQTTMSASLPVAIASNQSNVPVTQQTSTSGGSTPYHLVSANTTNATNVKNAAGQLYGFLFSNTNASARYVKLYNTSSSPTVGTDTPVATVQVPGNGVVVCSMPEGMSFGTGISFGTTTGVANSDTGAVGTSDLVIDLRYK